MSQFLAVPRKNSLESQCIFVVEVIFVRFCFDPMRRPITATILDHRMSHRSGHKHTEWLEIVFKKKLYNGSRSCGLELRDLHREKTGLILRVLGMSTLHLAFTAWRMADLLNTLNRYLHFRRTVHLFIIAIEAFSKYRIVATATIFFALKWPIGSACYHWVGVGVQCHVICLLYGGSKSLIGR